MTDTHVVSTTEYVVVERVIDCDGTCADADSSMKQLSTIEWEGLPPKLSAAIGHDSGDLWIKHHAEVT